MRAMILAAGLGTRLRPLTNDRPKALVEIDGHTLLEITLKRLASFGIREVIVNLHHFADLVVEYLRENKSFGMSVEISREEVLLDTGGGLKKAGWFFLDSGESFLLHNVDVVSTIDFGRMIEFHSQRNALATLAVQKRQTSRYLLFDEKGELCGRRRANHDAELLRPGKESLELAFSGVHIISPKLLGMMSEEGVFSVIETYLRLAGAGEKIVGFRADEYYWRDLGKPENLVQAAREAEQGLFQM